MTITLEKGIAQEILEELLAQGITDYCIAPGGRNAALVAILKREPSATCLYFNDERCAVFFALGRSRQTQKPVAVIVTSGTAVAHLLAGAMEAYYTSVPLVLLTADRPRRFRGSNAPQSCEQLGIFGQYAPCQLDVEQGEAVNLDNWDRRRPLHLNVCLEEPREENLAKESLLSARQAIFVPPTIQRPLNEARTALTFFLQKSRTPFVTVGMLREQAREAVVQFLLQLGAPVYLEGVSGIREEPRLQALSIGVIDKLWARALKADYPIDAVLRIGGVPTSRFWRDLEEREGEIPVFSLNEEPFSGLSWGSIACVPLKEFFEGFSHSSGYASTVWKSADSSARNTLQQFYAEEPTAEPSLIHDLSKHIPQEATLFLGQSLPIRIWDMAACRSSKHPHVFASRGLNGIDGQLSTFLGMCKPGTENWAILGDLTALHDLGGWWIVPQLNQMSFKVVVVNNGGGKIFSRMFSDKEIQNLHQLQFESLAKFWGIPHIRLEKIPEKFPDDKQLLIELCPDEEATTRFWKMHG